jgi:ABC-type multidrug transport system fused ATPase/permease subunit
MTLGMLLTNVTILGNIGKSTGQIYSSLLTIQRNVPSLERVVQYMNLPTDVKHRKTLNRARRATTKELRGSIFKSSPKGVQIPCDYLKISLNDFKFGYATQISEELSPKLEARKQKYISPRIDKMEIDQGSLVLLVGPRGEWKSTLLKILGGMVLPPLEREGELSYFVPSHLRVLHVSNEPMFFPGTLKENLLFGVTPGDPDGDDDRIEKICAMLGAPEQLLQLLSGSDVTQNWKEVLSQTQCQILSLARALISNPEVLCIHKPTMIFDEEYSRQIFEVLRNFVDQRGIVQDGSTWHLRRPRTCIITSNDIYAEKVADMTFHVSNAGIRFLNKDSPTEDSPTEDHLLD